jgi:hypothetical protein
MCGVSNHQAEDAGRPTTGSRIAAAAIVRLDVGGRVIGLRWEDAERLRAAGAGATSSRRRDLALALDWFHSSSRIVALRRPEARELVQLLAEDPSLAHLGDALGGSSHRSAAQ